MRQLTALILSIFIFAAEAKAQSTAFTYQGSLKNGTTLASGLYDFRFRLFDAVVAGNQVGTQQCIDNLSVADGFFTATLDFGQQFASTASRFLEIEVRQDTGLTCANAGGFVVLAPRQPINAAPLANHAKSAFSLDSPNGSVPNAVFVDNAGRVGIGTTSPALLLHLRNANPVMILQDTDSAANQAGYIGFWNNASDETAWVGFGTPGSPHFSILNSRSGGNIQLGAASTGQLTVASNNNVGIGITTPSAKLEVRGDIKLGTSGQYRATAGEENLRILRGTVEYDGTVLRGSGFTAQRLDEGKYRVTFTTPFAGVPTVTATSTRHAGDFQVAFAALDEFAPASVSQVTLVFYACPADEYRDSEFTFIAVGPR